MTVIDDLLLKIDSNFAAAFGHTSDIFVSASDSEKALDKLKHGKLFEVSALSELVTRLKGMTKDCSFELIYKKGKGSKLVLQGGPGMADPDGSFIRVLKRGTTLATIWTDVEFEGISSKKTGASGKSGTYHEADILVLSCPNIKAKRRPTYEEVLLVIECKHLASVEKVVLRNLLGLRREMSFVTKVQPSTLLSIFDVTQKAQLTQSLPADPASHLIFYYPDIYKSKPESVWADPGAVFGIEFWPD